ncbi:MAG: hypothetical protein R3362_06015, partial [Rhodothermales bacterium]|nr:hypothetical protein [Rhodothermales bacterium]
MSDDVFSPLVERAIEVAAEWHDGTRRLPEHDRDLLKRALRAFKKRLKLTQLDAESGTVVGRSLVHLDGETAHIRSRETNLGSLLADLLRTRFD